MWPFRKKPTGWDLSKLPKPGDTTQVSPNNPLPVVGRILAVEIVGERTPQDARVRLVYAHPTNIHYETSMPFLDAMYLLNLLRAVKEDIGFAMPEDPEGRGPPR